MPAVFCRGTVMSLALEYDVQTIAHGVSMAQFSRLLIMTAILVAGLLVAESAAAFRCGSKLVIDGMHEQQVLAICGEPATRRNLGYALRAYDLRQRRHPGSGWSRTFGPGFGNLVEEVIITEYVYNFGPRKLMQRLLFEGGVLVEIEAIGYGY